MLFWFNFVFFPQFCFLRLALSSHHICIWCLLTISPRLDINIAIQQQQQRLHAMLLFHFVDEHRTHKILYREFHQFALYHFAKDEDADVEEQRMQKQTHRTEKKENRRERLRSDFDVCASRHRTITTFAQVSEKRRQPTCNFKVEAANACEWIESLFRLPAGIFLISLSSRVVVGGAKSAYNSAAQWRRRLCESMMFKYIYTTEKKETRRHGRRRECGKILKQTKNIEMKWRKRRTEIEEAFRICE